MGTRLEQFLQCSAATPVEHASARAIALGTLFHIRHLQNDVARALAAAQALAGTLGAIPEASYSLFHPIVAVSLLSPKNMAKKVLTNPDSILFQG